MTIQKILQNVWFWFALMAIVIAIHYFWGKTPPPPRKPGKFFTKHKKTINKIMDICAVLFILLFWAAMMIFPIVSLLSALSEPPQIRATSLHFSLQAFLICAITASGFSGFIIGFLSTFQSSLTILKRIILLIISLLPITFTILALLIKSLEEPWLTIKLGLTMSLNCWIINGPAIIIGKHFIRVGWSIMRTLKLVSGEFPE